MEVKLKKGLEVKPGEMTRVPNAVNFYGPNYQIVVEGIGFLIVPEEAVKNNPELFEIGGDRSKPLGKKRR